MSVNEKRDKNIKSVLQLTKIGTIVMMLFCVLSLIFGYYICYYTWDIGVIGENSLTGFGSDTVAFVLYTLDFYICVCFAAVILVGVWKLVSAWSLSSWVLSFSASRSSWIRRSISKKKWILRFEVILWLLL